MSASYRVSHAMTHKPAASVIGVLRSVDTDTISTPDFEQMLEDLVFTVANLGGG